MILISRMGIDHTVYSFFTIFQNSKENYFMTGIMIFVAYYTTHTLCTVCEKYLANGKDVFWAFMDLEKAYDTIDRHGMCHIPHTILLCY